MKYIPFLFPVPIIDIKSNENIDINIDSILNKMSFSIFIIWFLIIIIFAIYYNIRIKNSIDEIEKVLYSYKRNNAIFILCIGLIFFSFYLIIYNIYFGR